jgi:hypothetical protein
MPITGIAGCCADAASGHATAVAIRLPINSRRLCDPERLCGLQIDDQLNFRCLIDSSERIKSLDHLVGASQQNPWPSLDHLVGAR